MQFFLNLEKVLLNPLHWKKLTILMYSIDHEFAEFNVMYILSGPLSGFARHVHCVETYNYCGKSKSILLQVFADRTEVNTKTNVASEGSA